MTLRERLAVLLAIITDEAERNKVFRRKLEEALILSQPSPMIEAKDMVRTPKISNDQSSAVAGSRKSGRRSPALLDPVALARQSEDVLRRELSSLDIEQLKDIVAQHAMDPGKLVMKWKDPTRVIDRIVELSMARSTKGDAFRAGKTTAPDHPGG